MDNYLIASRKKISSPQHHSQHRIRWIKSLGSHVKANIFVAIYGPNKLPKIKQTIQLRAQPCLETIDRFEGSNSFPRIYSLGEKSALNIIGRVEFRQPVDKKRNLYKLVIFTLENQEALLKITPPEEYKFPLPFHKRHVYCPLASSTFHMLYRPASEPGGYQGVITKIYGETELVEQYVPLEFQV